MSLQQLHAPSLDPCHPPARRHRRGAAGAAALPDGVSAGGPAALSPRHEACATSGPLHGPFAGDIGAALRGLPRFLTAERAILEALQRHGPNTWLTALEAIPRPLRMMYIHAYQVRPSSGHRDILPTCQLKRTAHCRGWSETQ